MKRSLLIITLLVVVGAFAGFQQYSSWSLNRSQNNNAGKTQAGAEQSSSRQDRSDGQARGGAGGGRSRKREREA